MNVSKLKNGLISALLFIAACVGISCNKSFFVDKSKIVHNGHGYLLFFGNDNCLLILDKSNSIDHFFTDTSKKFGYNVYGEPCGFYGLKPAAEKYLVGLVYPNYKGTSELILEDSIFITTTFFKYVKPPKQKAEWKGPVEFIFNNKRYKIYMSDKFVGRVLQVAGNTM
ncbi:hypothetical protein [Parafilimonas terrae]|uniref:Lipoprotein n=1 Tax=Parafilimonas terrae TaxID=1465490 RepID=A0A1I5WXV6_9BACT|nr:hypothetical protein [Parafilimonas terrae]SFQ24347.1 hypothetical protein SAMN05444277_10766 [Parafilimonas terrae]